MIATDETVRFRKHRDGSMTILNRDGTMILDRITKEQFDACRPVDEPQREVRGILLGMLLGGILWLPLGWLLFHG